MRKLLAAEILKICVSFDNVTRLFSIIAFQNLLKYIYV